MRCARLSGARRRRLELTPAVLEPELSAPVHFRRCRAATGVTIPGAFAALPVVRVRFDDRACVLGNARSDYLARYDPFGVPVVVAVFGAATGANAGKSRPLHPDDLLY